MGFEIDFRPVDAGEKSGDAIAFRFGNLHGTADEQVVFIVDGGYDGDGAALVEHVRRHYHTNRADVVVSTHPDADHVGGLVSVLENLDVGQLWMHRPWERATSVCELVEDGRATPNSVSERLVRALSGARKLEDIAERRGIRIVEPFAGLNLALPLGVVEVVGPTEDYYDSLAAEFVEQDRQRQQQEAAGSFFSRSLSAGVELLARAAESLSLETLTDDGETSPQNNSSVVLSVSVDGNRMLLTADAGIPALTRAADYIEAAGRPASGWKLLQVPHHGSKRNVGPTILDRLIGPKLSEELPLTTAYVSAAKEGAPKHPAKMVTNAFRRRGAWCYATQGMAISCGFSAPSRPGWGPIEPLPLYSEVDE